jgi:hypothetical protein
MDDVILTSFFLSEKDTAFANIDKIYFIDQSVYRFNYPRKIESSF